MSIVHVNPSNRAQNELLQNYANIIVRSTIGAKNGYEKHLKKICVQVNMCPLAVPQCEYVTKVTQLSLVGVTVMNAKNNTAPEL